jgi:hypothetical protein
MRFQQAFDPVRAVAESWRLARRAPVPMLVGGILLFVLTDGDDANRLRESLNETRHVRWIDLPELMLEAFVGAACLAWQVVILLAACFLGTTLPYAVERVATGGESLLADLLTTRGRFVPLVLAVLLGALAVVAAVVPAGAVVLALEWVGNHFGVLGAPLRLAQGAVVLLAIPVVVYVWLGVWLAEQAVAIEGLDPVSAVKRAWSLADGNRWWLLLYIVILRVFQALGILLCCVGVLGTGALGMIALNDSYLRLVRSDEEQEGWWIERADREAADAVPSR